MPITYTMVPRAFKPTLWQRIRGRIRCVVHRLLPVLFILAAGDLSAQSFQRFDTPVPANAFGTFVLGRQNTAGTALCNNDGYFCTFTFDSSAALRVNVVAGGAGGGVAQLQVRSAANAWTDVGFFGGNLNVPVNCISGCSGSSFADAAAFTFGTTTIGFAGHVVDDVATNTVAENSAGAGRMSTNRIPYFSLHTDAGVAIPYPVTLLNNALRVEDQVLTQVFVTTGELNTLAEIWDATGVRATVRNLAANDALNVAVTDSAGNHLSTFPISAAALPLPTGASTFAEQQTQTTALQIIDNLPVAQGSTTSGQSGILDQGAVTTNQPAYTTAQTSPLSLTVRGGLRTEANWPTCGNANWLPISGGDSIRCKAWNSAGCNNPTPAGEAAPVIGDCEEYQGLLRLKFHRKADPATEIVVSKVVTIDNDRAAAGVASGGGNGYPFGAAAGRQTSFSDADSPGANCAITSISTAELGTVCTHGFTINTRITVNITGSDGLATINGIAAQSVNGLHSVQILSTTTFRIIDMDVTTAGTATGNIFASRTLTSASNPFVVPTATNSGSVGKNITCATGGVVCTTADGPCQGPKFPIGTMYQGVIEAVASTSSVTVSPSLHVDPGGITTCKMEPILLGDDDATELGDGCLAGVDLNYWNSEVITLAGNRAGIKVGQTYYECEINKNPGSPTQTYNMHDGYTLFSDYQETSYHLSWAGGQAIKRHKVGDTHGWTHQVVVAAPAAGADWTYTVPTNAHVRITAIRATLTNSATAANRLPALIVDDGTANLSYVPVPLIAQTASQVTTYSWSQGVGARAMTPVAGNLQMVLELPSGLELTEGGRLRIVTTAIQAGDQWSSVIINLEEWIEE